MFSPQSVFLYRSIKVVLVVLVIITLLTKQNLYLSLTETAGNLVMFNGWVVDPRYEDSPVYGLQIRCKSRKS